MLSDKEITGYRERVVKQLLTLQKIDVDPYTDEDAHEHKLMIAFKEGQVFALNNILDGFKTINKSVSFTLSGYSDDNVELNGDIDDEIGAYDVVSNFVISDGTRGTIEYTDEGVWRINILEQGTIKIDIIHPTQDEIDNDTNYTDRATFTGDIDWIVFDGGQIFKPR